MHLCQPKDLRGNNLDFLRFLFATTVVFSHSFPLLHGNNKLEPLIRATHGQLTFGELAVDAFFVVSGFLIALSWEQSASLVHFLTKRILRIYPGYIAACLFSVLIAGRIGAAHPASYFGELQWSRILQRMLFLDSPQLARPPTFGLNGSLWTIQPECICYLLIVTLGAMKLFSHRSMTLGLSVIIYGIMIFGVLHGEDVSVTYARFFTYFLAGTNFYLYRDKIPRSNSWAGLALVALIISFWFPFWTSLLLPLAGGYILFHTAFNQNLKLHHFARFGDLSYGVYLYAYPIQQILIFYFRDSLNPITLFLTALPISCFIAALSWHMIENPCLKLKPRKKKQLAR